MYKIKNVRNFKYRKQTIVVIVLLFALLGSFYFQTTKSYAFTPDYVASNLIDNGSLLNDQTMSVNAIQTFLTNEGSGLANYSDVESCDAATQPYYPSCGQTLPASQLIYDVSQAYSINPRVILAEIEKEQSLVTDPTPTSSQLDCAMGYNSCSGFSGFFTQIDNGAWQLRTDFELMSGNDYWGYTPADYPCASANPDYYNNGLYPGNTVTFEDSGGTPETLVLANAATAALYCYTPYVGPMSVTGYSGNYNFVYYYQLWFGSTQTSTAYAWNYESQALYTNSSYTTAFNTPIANVQPGQTIYAQIKARNVGYENWLSNMHVGTDYPEDSADPFYNSSWLDANRPGGMTTSSVSPGYSAIFDFSLTAPQQTGTYTEYFNLVDDGVTWLNDPGLYFKINVVDPQPVSNSTNTGMSDGSKLLPGQYLLSPDGQTSLNLMGNGDLVEYQNYLPVWSNNINISNVGYLILQTDGNLVEYNTSGVAVWNANTAGNSGDSLSLLTNGDIVLNSASGSTLWSTNTISTTNHLDMANTELPVGGMMYPGEYIQTANEQYRLQLQYDGNLVEYNSAWQPIWASNTNGQNVSALIMQTDGNLVLYNSAWQPIWASNTPGLFSNVGVSGLFLKSTGTPTICDNYMSCAMWSNNGFNSYLFEGQSISSSNGQYKLVLQYDGNLVEYNSSGQALWDSNTHDLPVAFLVLQSHGNLVLYSTSMQPLWSSNTPNSNADTLIIHGNGNITLDNNSMQQLFSTNS